MTLHRPRVNFFQSIVGIIALLLIIGHGLCSAVHAEDWIQWRGPNRNGISPESKWLNQWSDGGPTILWKATVGMGFSSFVVSNGKVFTMGNADNSDTVFALDAMTGIIKWKHTYPSDLGDKYFEGGTTGTPTIDGDNLYTLSRWGDVFCFQASTGKILWTRNVQVETGARVPSWGFTGAPLVIEKMLILNVGETGLALDKSTGKTLWQSSTKEAGYTTPVPWVTGGKSQVVFGSGQGYIGVDSLSGKEVWRMKWVTQYGVNAADPVIDGDRLFISSGYGKGAALIKPLASGEPELVWKSKVLRTQMNAAVLFDKHLYGIDGDTTEKPLLKCVELATGAEKWSDSTSGTRGLLIANGRLILLGEKGELIIAPASPSGFKPTSRAQVLGGKSWTAPILANGMLFCRNSRGEVVNVDLRTAATP